MFASIVLCTYNRAHLLTRALDCYKNQSFKNFELIIIDDNSQDETEELINNYKKNLNYKTHKID